MFRKSILKNQQGIINGTKRVAGSNYSAKTTNAFSTTAALQAPPESVSSLKATDECKSDAMQNVIDMLTDNNHTNKMRPFEEHLTESFLKNSI